MGLYVAQDIRDMEQILSDKDIDIILMDIHLGSFSDADDTVIEDLTSMEKKILHLISSGKKRKSIAAELYMSERTLSNHLQHIFEKLGVSSTVFETLYIRFLFIQSFW